MLLWMVPNVVHLPPGADCRRTGLRFDWGCCCESIRGGESQSPSQQRFLQTGALIQIKYWCKVVLMQRFKQFSQCLFYWCVIFNYSVQQPSSFAQARLIIKKGGFGLNGLNKGLTSTLGRHGIFNMIYFSFYFNVKDAIPASQVSLCSHSYTSWDLSLIQPGTSDFTYTTLWMVIRGFAVVHWVEKSRIDRQQLKVGPILS